MNLDDILAQWETDCEIGHRLDEASSETPKLHAKYLRLLSQAKFQLKRAEDKQRRLLKNKHLYYNGKMSQQEIDGLGWQHDPFDGLKMMQKDLDYWYESDTDIQESESTILYYRTILDTLNEIIQVLRWRHSTIKNIIDVRRFEAGA